MTAEASRPDASLPRQAQATAIAHAQHHIVQVREVAEVAYVLSLRDILGVLDQSSGPEDVNLPGFRLHSLRGPSNGHYAVWVSGKWRVTFRFEDGVAVDVNYVGYH